MGKTTKLRIAVLVSHPIQYHVPLYRELDRRGDVELVVYYCSDQGVTEKIDAGFGISFKWDIPLLQGYKYKFLKNYSLRPNPDTFFGLINPGIISELLRERYDAVWVHGYSLMSNWLAFLGAWFSRTPILFRGETVLREGRPWWVRAVKYMFLKPLFWGISAFLTIGSRSEKFYEHYGVPRGKMFFTPYAVDNEYFIGEYKKYMSKKGELKKKLGIPEHIPVILFMGKLIKRKRPGDLLRAFSELEAGKAALVYVGDGELRKELEEKARRGHTQNVFFLGFKNQSELPQMYVLADIFALPSEHEVSPLVINEAMCSGLPIVVSDAVPSAIDFVKPGENGFIYPMGSIGELSQRLMYLLDNPATREEMGRRSLEFIGKWNHGTSAQHIVGAALFARR